MNKETKGTVSLNKLTMIRFRALGIDSIHYCLYL